jgi:hypothetical protein
VHAMKTSRRNFFGFLFALPLALKAKLFPPVDHEAIASAKSAMEIMAYEDAMRRQLAMCRGAAFPYRVYGYAVTAPWVNLNRPSYPRPASPATPEPSLPASDPASPANPQE